MARRRQADGNRVRDDEQREERSTTGLMFKAFSHHFRVNQDVPGICAEQSKHHLTESAVHGPW